jgi:iron(III) transport system permease protein
MPIVLIGMIAETLRWIRPRRGPAGPMLFAGAAALLAAVPVLVVWTNAFSSGTGETWRHLAGTVLPEYVANTLVLCLGVGVGVIVVGVTTAWLTATHEFPGRRVFEWALVLPLAVPTYVMAYTYTDLLQYVGPVQSGLREAFGWGRDDYWFPEVRSVGGAVALFVFVLYPYVYLLARAAFLERASGMIEVGRSLGLGPWRSFFRISLPLARPAVAAGAALALMETLADYGAVSYFGVQTFTTGIYRAWFALGDRSAAAQLSTALLAFVAVVLLIERTTRGRARYHDTTARNRQLPGRRLEGGAAIVATLCCTVPLIAGFLLPAGILLEMTWTEGDARFGARFLQLAGNSATLAGITAVLAVLLSLSLAYSARLSGGGLAVQLNRIVGLGYAVPGTVIAVGVLIPVTQLDAWLAIWMKSRFGFDPGLLLTGGIGALVYAYLVRFLAAALQTVDAGLSKITPSMDDAARSLGCGHRAILARVHAPMLRSSLLTAGLLVFVEVMKELPATLVMRPFNFDTLATQAFTLASDERLAEASTSALSIVAVGVLPLIVLSRQIARARRR